MSKPGEDVVPEAYSYAWSPSSNVPLKDFITKYKPSMVQDDGTKPWIWVKKSDPEREDEDVQSAVAEAKQLLKETTEKVENIKNDDSIPTRANKKKGIKSKKELREEAQHEATEKLKEISISNGYVSGKWLIFAPADRVDAVWSSVALSLVEGPLASTKAYLAKVATSPKNDTPNYQHVICIYLPDVYDKDSVLEVMKVLLRNHGLNLSAVKSNLYTDIGLDSKHPSGIQSTVWRNNALMKDTEMKELKDAYFAEINATKIAAAADKPEEPKPSTTASKFKLKKKKKDDDDPFASDDEDEGGKNKDSEGERPKSKQNAKKPAPVKNKKDGNDGSASEGDSEDSKPRRKVQPQAKKGSQATQAKLKATKRSRDESETESEEEPPKKKSG
ncbi:hypothetical protein K474DRAFT_1592248 [Panus rudis PR-1116 ss-1]|nr:hypothetical protein K474DRAFT_1592248 [Panus rudis PR-1116 ss-1]